MSATPAKPIDKSTWGPGPWQDEPDRVEFKHAGLPCLMVRNDLGNWCGYAAVTRAHPLYGQNYDNAEIEVHGGLTYADKCSGEICHVPEPGESDDVWWFGFDCGHTFDLSPGRDTLVKAAREFMEAATGKPIPALRRATFDRMEVYRDVAYVAKATESLAEQLAAITVLAPPAETEHATA